MSAAKRYDGAAILGEVSGLGKAEVMKAWEQAKANGARLEACAVPHDFRRAEEAPGRSFTCSKCGGTARPEAVHWYEAGLAHGVSIRERA